MNGLQLRAELDRTNAIIGGWIGALMQRQREMPDLPKVLGWFGPEKSEPRQSFEEMRSAMRAWVVVTGGALATNESGE
ncbi:MAG: hypothetical protein RIS94_3281 [Pseudomonadota bacterium]|jgi:hypothetical protein